MSFAVGIDLQPFIEVESSLATFGERYTRRLYTSSELSELSELSDEPNLIIRKLAALFAAKEAVMKVLAPSDVIPSWLDIEVSDVKEFSASVVLSGVAARLARRQGISDITITLGITQECAAATAVAQKTSH